MAGTGKNLIFASRAAGNSHEGGPTYIEGLIEGDILPGTIVQQEYSTGNANLNTFNPGASAGAGAGRAPLVMDLNGSKQGNVSDAWASGETATAMRPRAGQKFNVRTGAAFTATPGTPLTINSSGQVAVAVSGDLVFCQCDEAVSALAVNSLVRTVWNVGHGQTLVA